MEQICGYVVLFALLLFFVKMKFGLAVYLVYFFLVPFLQVEIGVTLSYNLVNTAVLVSMFIYLRRNKYYIDTSPIKPFLIFFLCSFLIIPFQFDVPYLDQFNYFRLAFMTIVFLPLALWNVISTDNKSIWLFESCMIICIIVACLYGLLLTQTPGFNPYIMTIMDITGEEYDFDWFLDEGSGRLFGRISSVFLHPMTFALFLGMSTIFLYSLLERWNKIFIVFVLCLVFINIVTCGVRSVLVGIAVSFFYYILKGKHYKLALYTFFSILIIILLVGVNSDLGDYLGSITHSDGEGVKGSSVEMRIDQLMGAFTEIQDCFIQGKGYAWTTYYYANHGTHPVLLAFESLLFVVLCNSGIIGMFFWLVLVKKIMSITQKVAGDKTPIINSLLVFYISFACITGDYHYMKYYALFYIIMLGGALYNRNRIKNETKKENRDNRILSASVSSDC